MLVNKWVINVDVKSGPTRQEVEMATGEKAVQWHKLPYAKFVMYEAKRPMFRPFLYGAA